MIKLIASDMDGTLLTDKKEFPPDFFGILDELDKKGIRFAVASGRSFSSLKISFGDYAGRLDFICDNGACVISGGKAVSMSILDSAKLAELLELCHSLKGVTPILCGVNGVYFENAGAEFLREAKSYYLQYTCVEDIREVRDDIFKVAVCDTVNPETNSYPAVTEKFSEDFTVAVTGPKWIDVMNKGINKGAALRKMQERLGISPAETMAFGDYFNDAELLEAAEYGFIMENAHPGMFRYGKYRAESNNSFGVTKAIKEFVLEQRKI